MSDFETLIFDSPKILSSTLRYADDHEIAYTVSTAKRGRGSSKQTTALLEEGIAHADGQNQVAAIDWREKTFEISGERRRTNELQTKRTTFSSSRYWSWFEQDEYKVKYSAETENTWTLFSYSGQVLATLTSRIQRLLAPNSLPVLRIASSIHDEDERRFIILVLLYSETKRLESLKERPMSIVSDLMDSLPFPSN
ncbi:hypothetical protein C8F01DRAFT_1156795 [Mycena amicta]|nr:hypothetical protein C8F01DRAFT_1156795 [Mycena amicta]